MRRRLTYEEAIHVRESVLAGRMTTRDAARAYKIGMESIRRIVRGETYANPEIDEYGRGIAEAMPQGRLVEEARASADRLVEALRASADQEGGDSATEKLLADIAQARAQARAADSMLEELQGQGAWAQATHRGR